MSRVDRTTNERQTIRPEAPDRREALPLELGHAAAALAARPEDHLRRRPTGSSSPPTAATPGTAISPDLTRGDGPRHARADGHQGQGHHGSRRTTACRTGRRSSPSRSRGSKAGVIWTGSDDGLVQVTRDGGATWADVTDEDPRRAEAGLRLEGGAVEVRRGHGLRHLRRPPHRRLRHLRLRHHRLRRDLEVASSATCPRGRWCGRSPRTSRTPTCSTWARKPGSG